MKMHKEMFPAEIVDPNVTVEGMSYSVQLDEITEAQEGYTVYLKVNGVTLGIFGGEIFSSNDGQIPRALECFLLGLAYDYNDARRDWGQFLRVADEAGFEWETDSAGPEHEDSFYWRVALDHDFIDEHGEPGSGW